MFRPNRRLLLDTVSVGRFASESTVVDNYSVAIGRKAGQNQMGTYAIAVGELAGEKQQGISAIAIGRKAGQNQMGDNTIAVGELAGETAQGISAIAIGSMAGQTTQATMAIAIGEQAGQTTQATVAIAIGKKAGNENQGKYAIAIGAAAGVKDQPEYSIIISTAESEIVAVKKGLYIDPIRKFDDREDRPATVKEGNILSYNYKNNTPEETKEVVTGFPRLPGYPTDSDVAAAIALTAEDAGTMYFDTTKKKIKVYDGAKWTALADEEDIKKAMAAAAAAAAAAAVSARAASAASKGGDVYVPNSGADPFVIGGLRHVPEKILITDPNGTVREAAASEFYWDFTDGPRPIFYKDLEVVSVTRVGGNIDSYPNGGLPANRGGYVSTNYNNGHSILEQIPLAEWNPPLAAMGKLPESEARAIFDEYTTSRGIDFMTQGGYDQLGSWESDDLRSFLESKGIGK